MGHDIGQDIGQVRQNVINENARIEQRILDDTTREALVAKTRDDDLLVKINKVRTDMGQEDDAVKLALNGELLNIKSTNDDRFNAFKETVNSKYEQDQLALKDLHKSLMRESVRIIF